MYETLPKVKIIQSQMRQIWWP